MKLKKSFQFLFQPLLICSLFTVLFLWPLWPKLATHLPSREDGVLISYLITWVSQTLAQGGNIYQVPFFHPFPNTLAYSDPFFSTAVLTLPLLLFTQNIVLIHNLHLVGGTFFLCLGMYLLSHFLFRSRFVAALCTLFFTFSYFHFHYLVHLHTYLLAGIPFCLYFFLQWRKTSQKYFLVLSALSFLYQTLNAPMTGFFTLFVMLPILIEKKSLTTVWTQRFFVATIGCATLLIATLFYLPYFQVAQTLGANRTIRDAAHFGHSLNFFLLVDVLLPLGVIGAVHLWRLRHPHSPKKTSLIEPKTFWLMTLIGAVLLLGPTLKFNGETVKIFGLPIPLPYAVLYYIVPGFKAFRATSRWMVVFGFGVALLLGKSLSLLKLSRPIKITTILLTAVLLWWLHISHLTLHAVPQHISPLNILIQEHPAQVIAELPIYSWRMFPYAAQENDRLLAQLQHGKTLHNGVSGFTPPQREKEWDIFWKEFPSPESVQYLKREGVELIVLHYDEYEHMANDKYIYAEHPAPQPQVIRTFLEQHPEVGILSCLENTCLYELK